MCLRVCIGGLLSQNSTLSLVFTVPSITLTLNKNMERRKNKEDSEREKGREVQQEEASVNRKGGHMVDNVLLQLGSVNA